MTIMIVHFIIAYLVLSGIAALAWMMYRHQITEEPPTDQPEPLPVSEDRTSQGNQPQEEVQATPPQSHPTLNNQETHNDSSVEP